MNFNASVRQILQPLLFDKGFAFKDEHNGLVQYCNNELSIRIIYDIYSFEVDAAVVFKDNENTYTYSELKKCFDYKLDTSLIQITNEEVLISWLLEVKEYFVLYLDNILQNLNSTQLALQEIRKDESYVYNHNRYLTKLHSEINKFWEAKDYKGLVDFVNGYKKVPLKDIYDLKYKYAMKHI